MKRTTAEEINQIFKDLGIESETNRIELLSKFLRFKPVPKSTKKAKYWLSNTTQPISYKNA